MAGIRVHSQQGNDHDRPFDKGIDGDSISAQSVNALIDSAFASLPRRVRDDSANQVTKLKAMVKRSAGTVLQGSGYGRNFLDEDMSDGWHIDVEVSGSVRLTD